MGNLRSESYFDPELDLQRGGNTDSFCPVLRPRARTGILAAHPPVNNRNGLGYQNAFSRTPPRYLYHAASLTRPLGLPDYR